MSLKDLIKPQSSTPANSASAPQEQQPQRPTYSPRVDIIESSNAFRLLADMPGCDEKSIRIDLEGNTLTLSGQTLTTPPAGHTLAWQEYRNGNYERAFTLGESIDRNGIQAAMKDGTLCLTLPKAKEAQPRRISVSAG